MAIFDGLIDWWGFGDAAAAIAGPGSVVFADKVPVNPHDGVYGGHGTLAEFAGSLNETSSEGGVAWTCGDAAGIRQLINGDDPIHPVIDPQLGHNANNLGVVPFPIDTGVPWWSYTSWTFVIFGLGAGGYYIARTGPVTQQFLCGDSIVSSGFARGWNITANYDLGPNPVSGQFTADGLHNSVDFLFTGEGHWQLDDSEEIRRSMVLGPISGGYDILAITGDGTSIRTYGISNPADGLVLLDEESGVMTGGIGPLSFGARNNQGTDDGGYPAPFNGSFDECLLWNRALSLAELRDLNHACDSNIRIKKRFRAVNAEPNDTFARARTLRGASGQTIPWSPAGHGVQATEPKGAKLRNGLNQTSWFRWVAPASGSVTFHTANGHPADIYSAAPLDADPQFDPVIDPTPPDVSDPVVGQDWGALMYCTATDGTVRAVAAAVAASDPVTQTVIDWLDSTWTPVTFPYEAYWSLGASFGSDETLRQAGWNLPNWQDVADNPPDGGASPMVSSDSGASFDTTREHLWQIGGTIIWPCSKPLPGVEDLNHPVAGIIGIDFAAHQTATFACRLRETTTDTVISFRKESGFGQLVNTSGLQFGTGIDRNVFNVPYDWSLFPLGIARLDAGLNFVVEIWQNTGGTLHTAMSGYMYMRDIGNVGDDTYPYPVFP